MMGASFFVDDPVIFAVCGAMLVSAAAMVGLGRHLLVGAVLLASGCSSLTLRPVNANHWMRKTEVMARLGVDETALNQLLPAEQAACDKLDGQVTGWTATALVVGVLSGGSGVTSIFTDSTPRYVVGGVGVGLAATAALAAYMSTTLAQNYARKCTVNTGGR